MQSVPLVACLALLALAGCAASPASIAPQRLAAPEPTVGHAFRLEGTLWLPVSLGASPTRSSVNFTVNATQAATTFGFHLAWTLPTPTPAMAMISLHDNAGRSLGQAMLMPPGPYDAAIHVDHLDAGSYSLVFDTHGGSNGSSGGDFINYNATGAPA